MKIMRILNIKPLLFALGLLLLGACDGRRDFPPLTETGVTIDRDIILLIYTVYLALFYNHVTQANLFGKLFIFTTTLMIITYIYKVNELVQILFYYSSIILLIISAINYIKSHNNTINRYEHI